MEAARTGASSITSSLTMGTTTGFVPLRSSAQWQPARGMKPSGCSTRRWRPHHARKALVRGRDWDAVAAFERARRSLTHLRGHRDGLRLYPYEPARAMAAVVAGMQEAPNPGARRRALLAAMQRAP